MTFNIRVEPLSGTRWRASIVGLPGAVGYGNSPEAALLVSEELAASFVTDVDLRLLIDEVLLSARHELSQGKLL